MNTIFIEIISEYLKNEEYDKIVAFLQQSNILADNYLASINQPLLGEGLKPVQLNRSLSGVVKNTHNRNATLGSMCMEIKDDNSAHKVLEALLKAGFDVNVANEDRYGTPLLFKLLTNPQLAELAVQYGASLTAESYYDYTVTNAVTNALDYSLRQSYNNTAKMLIDYGALAKFRNFRDRETLLYYIIKNPTLDYKEANFQNNLFYGSDSKNRLLKTFANLLLSCDRELQLHLLDIAISDETALGKIFNHNDSIVKRKITNTRKALIEYSEHLQQGIELNPISKAYQIFHRDNNPEIKENDFLKRISGFPCTPPRANIKNVEIPAADIPSPIEQLIEQLHSTIDQADLDEATKARHIKAIVAAIHQTTNAAEYFAKELTRDKLHECGIAHNIFSSQQLKSVAETAVTKGYIDCLEYLVKPGKEQSYLLEFAAFHGNLFTFDRLLDLNVELIEKPITLAARDKKLAALSLLQQTKGDVDKALHQAIKTDNLKAITQLIELGPDLSAIVDGKTPLFDAAENSHVHALAILLSYNPLKNTVCNGKTALAAALDNNHFAAATLLVLAGANVGTDQRKKLQSNPKSIFLALKRIYSNAPADARAKIREIASNEQHTLGSILCKKTRLGLSSSYSEQIESFTDLQEKPSFWKGIAEEKTYHPAIGILLGVNDAPAAPQVVDDAEHVINPAPEPIVDDVANAPPRGGIRLPGMGDR